MKEKSNRRPKIAFFDYADVFEDFYPHYGVTQETFATTWHNTGSHVWLKIIQDKIGDVTWYELSLKPAIKESQNHYVDCKVKFVSSSFLHRKMWKFFYLGPFAAKSWKYYKAFGTLASYLSIASCQLIQTLIKDKPDVFLVQDYGSGKFDMLILLSKIFRKPLLTIHTGSRPEEYLGRFFRPYTLRKASWICPSGQNELKMLNKNYKVSLSKLSVLRPPVNTDVYKPLLREEACKRTGLDETKRYWIFVGRLDDGMKRVSAIIEAFSKLSDEYPNIDLLIMGSGKDEENLKKQATGNILGRVHFIGWIDTEEKKAWYYNVAECLLLASKREGFPTVIGEAFACNIPVISSDVGTISDLVVHGKTGWLFPAYDDKAMLICFRDAASNPGKIAEKKLSLRSIAMNEVSFAAVSDALEAAFHTVLNKK